MWKFKDYGKSYFELNPIAAGGERQYLGKTFYSCNYVCPKCKENLLKSNVKRELIGHVQLDTENGNRSFTSVFLCYLCNDLYSTGQIGGFKGSVLQYDNNLLVDSFNSSEGFALGDGKVYVLENVNEVCQTVIAIENGIGSEIM